MKIKNIIVIVAVVFFEQSTICAQLESTNYGAVVCLKDPTDWQSSNSFLITSGSEHVLVDPGWSVNAEVPATIQNDIRTAVKVATHFHFDHIRAWENMGSIYLSEKQARHCEVSTCRPSRLDTVSSVSSFNVERVFSDKTFLPTGIEPVSCSGHSRVDACFIHPASKMLFLGDIFYPGPVYVFLPGGSLQEIRDTMARVLADKRWDHVALTHGSCFAERGEVEKFAKSIGDVNSQSGQWTFKFWFPLRVFPTTTGTIILWPFQAL